LQRSQLVGDFQLFLTRYSYAVNVYGTDCRLSVCNRCTVAKG